jgi:hypothetical protein
VLAASSVSHVTVAPLDDKLVALTLLITGGVVSGVIGAVSKLKIVTAKPLILSNTLSPKVRYCWPVFEISIAINGNLFSACGCAVKLNANAVRNTSTFSGA